MRKIFLQDQVTKCFLGERGEWTINADGARNFPASLNAIVHCLQKEYGRVQLIVRIDNAPLDIVIPLDEQRSAIARDFTMPSHAER